MASSRERPACSGREMLFSRVMSSPTPSATRQPMPSPSRVSLPASRKPLSLRTVAHSSATAGMVSAGMKSRLPRRAAEAVRSGPEAVYQITMPQGGTLYSGPRAADAATVCWTRGRRSPRDRRTNVLYVGLYVPFFGRLAGASCLGAGVAASAVPGGDERYSRGNWVCRGRPYTRYSVMRSAQWMSQGQTVPVVV